jgi:tetratricopeptide (TPR) repeat protein/predicted Ser/Thr protein kinase
VQQIGRYEVLEEIARGGMGVVFKALDPVSKRKVAIKVLLSPDPDPRFLQEIRSLARLQHPGIVAFYDMAQDHAGRDFVVMELVEGESLQSRLRRDGPLPVDEALDLTQQLAEAIDYAHQRGVLHRDLKPHNVLVTPDGRVKLTDFGLGKVVNQTVELSKPSLTLEGELMGTPAYMPPEQAAGEKDRMGPASDVYSLGATLYALLTGKPPFEAEGAMALVYAVLEKQPDPPSKHRSEIPPEVDALVLRCLAKEPGDRYASVAEVIAVLEGKTEIETEEVLARTVRGGGWRALAVAGVLILLLAGALAIAVIDKRSTRTVASPSGVRPLVDESPLPDAPGEAEPVSTVGETAEAELWEGRSLFQEGRLREAAALLEAAAQRFPQHAQIRASIGELRGAQGDWEGAIEELTEALRLDPTLPVARYNRAVAHRRLGDWESALEDLNEAIRQDPDDALSYAERGSLRAEHQPDHPGALEDLDHALRLRPDHAEYYFSRGTIRFQRGEVPEAILDYGQAVDRDPDHLQAYYNRAVAHERLDDYQAVLKDCTEAIRIDPDCARAYARRATARAKLNSDPEGVAHDLERALELDPDQPAVRKNLEFVRSVIAERDSVADQVAEVSEELRHRPNDASKFNERGVAREAAGDYSGAIEDYTRALELDPDYAQAYYNRGTAKGNSGDWQGQLEDCSEAIRLDPTFTAAYVNRGTARSHLGALEQAIQDFNRALELNPSESVALVNRGATRRLLSDYEGAIADCTEALKFDPKLAVAYAERARARAKLSDWRGSLRDASEAIGLTPEVADYYEIRLVAHSNLGNYAAQLEDADRYLRFDQDSALGFANRGNARLKLGDLQGAIADSTKAIELDPSLVAPLRDRCLARTNAGDSHGALEDAKTWSRLDPDDAEAYIAQGLALSSLGDKVGSIDAFGEAIRVAPQSQMAYYNRGISHAQLGDDPAAIQDYSQAIRILPADPAPYFQRAKAHKRLGNAGAAIEDLTEAIARAPQQARNYNERGVLHFEQGNYAAAVADFEKVLEIAPNTPRQNLEYARQLLAEQQGRGQD